MFAVLLAAQVAVAHVDTATYSSAAVRTLVTEASALNRIVPVGLGTYHAHVETEIMLGVHSGSGQEVAFSMEQLASDLTWSRTGEFAQHVTGYRSQTMGFASLIGLFRNSWFVPTLYGNRLALMWGTDPTRRHDSTYYAVHPLAVDRERYYRFAGGDTVQRLRIDNREIRIARVDVSVRDDIPRHTVVFTGEVDLDLARRHIVRMRGAFYVASGKPQQSQRFASLEVLQFVEFVNSEVDGQFWLPQYQRYEDQIGAEILGEAREAIRIVSQMRDVTVNAPESTAVLDEQRALPHRITFAPSDSLGKYRDWQKELGASTISLTTVDFNDVGPDRLRPTGPPSTTVEVEHIGDLAHYNRVEGLFTGIGVLARLRDAAPGVSFRASGGYAWTEQTVRGRVRAELKRGPWTYAVLGGRSLDITNDFRNGVDSGSSLGPALGIDDHDYVDRYSAGVSLSRRLGKNAGLIRVESGWASDRATVAHLEHGLWTHVPYLRNRGIDAGAYARNAVTIEWRPGVMGEDLIRPGVGASVSYVRGDGTLDFQRIELAVTSLHNFGQWRFATRARAGEVFGNPPPQELFELGGDDNLPGFEYKEFAGNVAASLRSYALYRIPYLQGPLMRTTSRRLFPSLVIPGVSPAVFVSVQGGWTGATNDVARAAIARLGTRALTDSTGAVTQVPASITMGNPRGSVGAGLSFFQGFIGFGIARPLDRIAKWRGRLAFGLSF